MASFRLVYVAIHGTALGHLAAARRYAESGGFLDLFGDETLIAMVSDAFVSHRTGFEIALVFFGVHLVLLGIVMVRAPYLPTLIGVLVAISGGVYVANAAAFFGFPHYADHELLALSVVSVTAVIAELGLAGYLLIVGVGRRYPGAG